MQIRISKRRRYNKVDFPSAVSTKDRSYFLDDLVKSVDSSQAAITCYQDLVETLKRSGFTLRKWASNCPEGLRIIPVEDR